MRVAIYDVDENSVSVSLAEEYIEQNTLEITESWNKVGMDALVDGGTALNAAAPTTAAKFETAFLASRAALVGAVAKPDVLIASVAMYNLMLADKTKFTPETNEMKMKEGIVGYYNGIKVYEYQNFKQIGGFDVSFVMYDHQAFAVATNVASARIVDGAPNITGVFAQAAINSGFLVTNAERVSVHVPNV